MIWRAGVIFALLIGGCSKEDMATQPKDKPMQSSNFFADGASARPLVAGTVARGSLQTDSTLYQGFTEGKLATSFPDHYPTPTDGPFPTNGNALRNVLENGKSLYAINCLMCHGDSGDGRGIVVERGFAVPPSYHIDRLRTAPVGHFFDVITNGYGAMYSYGDRIAPADRWAIVAYIRTLQMSQAMDAAQLSSAQRNRLDAEGK